ncbi:MAG: UvrD-helicase domain-containing protein [Candidatus Tectomicrobia bacterium]|nr:UvrD-helicase domain-containing protein [Candidatus Tectomicrobia bacterium]
MTSPTPQTKSAPPLNPQQRAAVEHTEGPLLVFAGAGSGKTFVITQRIAHLVHQRGVAPQQIIALTFTNKAAGEMRERLAAALGPLARGIWISTFHAACTRILRRHHELLGLPQRFVIYDAADQKHLLKQVLRDLKIDATRFPEAAFASRISRLKSDPQAPPPEPAAKPRFGIEQHLAAVAAAYDEALRANGAVDFDDLLRLTVELWESYPAVLETYRETLRYVLVDEYQDTNAMQWRLLDLLCRTHQNLCVVGDDDQSIYRWRGADVGNILEFARHYPKARVITLGENYRSSETILHAASAVVARNRRRQPKELFTGRGPGEKIILFEAYDEEEEASFITAGVRHRREAEGTDYRDIAVFFRTNAQSRVVEDGLRRAGIPYQVVGGLKFYDRKEVKDLLAYVRLLVNPRDDVSLLRIINVPPRGIGAATLQRLTDYAKRARLPLLEAVRHAAHPHLARAEDADLGAAVAGKAARGHLQQFVLLLDELGKMVAEASASETLTAVLRRSGYLESLAKEEDAQAESRRENLNELISAAQDFEQENDGEVDVAAFLDHAALVAHQDVMSDASGVVTLMTLHASKGLEFDTVFMAGMEEGLFPHERSRHTTAELEEERRLCYVGMTRAKNRLLMSWATTRRVGGQRRSSLPSQFLADLPQEDLTEAAVPHRLGGQTAALDRATLADGMPRRKPRASRERRELAYEVEPAAQSGGEASTSDGYRRGMRVRHAIFGVGVVREVSGSGDTLKLSVEFPGAGVKKLMVKYAGLEVVEPRR